MDNTAALIQEFIARKEQVLNLEMRQFILIFALEAIFLVCYCFFTEKLRNDKRAALTGASCFLMLFLELIAVNGKMQTVSVYLQQLETYLAKLGQVGVVWETKAIDVIIFSPGNAFTLPAAFVILLLMSQTIHVVHSASTHLLRSKPMKWGLTATICGFIFFLIIKTLTKDFFHQYPSVFP